MTRVGSRGDSRGHSWDSWKLTRTDASIRGNSRGYSLELAWALGVTLMETKTTRGTDVGARGNWRGHSRQTRGNTRKHAGSKGVVSRSGHPMWLLQSGPRPYTVFRCTVHISDHRYLWGPKAPTWVPTWVPQKLRDNSHGVPWVPAASQARPSGLRWNPAGPHEFRRGARGSPRESMGLPMCTRPTAQ